MNQPNCGICNNATQGIGNVPPSEEDKQWGAGIVENYICRKCNKNFTFPRYNHPQKLLGKCFLFLTAIDRAERRGVIFHSGNLYFMVQITNGFTKF